MEELALRSVSYKTDSSALRIEEYYAQSQDATEVATITIT